MMRVRFFAKTITMPEAIDLNEKELFWKVGNEFKETKQGEWVNNNNVSLFWSVDDVVLAFGKRVTFYGDLDDQQMFDYTLRFCDGSENWK